MKFAYALIAAVAFAQDDAPAPDAQPQEQPQAPPQEQVVDSWTSDVVWEADTGVTDWEKASNWAKKFTEADQTVAGIPTTLTAAPDADGVVSLTVDMEGSWPIAWADANNSKSKAISGCMDMGWVATVDEADPEVPTSWEFTGVTVTRDATAVQVSDLWNSTGLLTEESVIDWTAVGADNTPGLIADAAAVTAWTGSGEAVVADGNITGVRMTATRPLVPTAERASALTLVNQLPAYMCASVWTTEGTVSGSAEAGCALVTINIPVPEPEPEPVVPDTESGASTLTATALAVAAIAVMAF